MSDWKVKWVCQDCGTAIWAHPYDEPEDYDCRCEVVEEYVETNPLFLPIPEAEKKARYKEQYRRNGYTWLGRQPWQYMGAFDEYINRGE